MVKPRWQNREKAMPKKITVDQSGTVILVEDVPERDSPLPQPKQGTGKKTQSKTNAGKKAKQRHPLNTDTPYAPPARRESTKPLAELMACTLCNTNVPKRRMAKHLREAHLQETIERRQEEIKNIDRDRKKLAPGFHRLKIEELERQRSILLEDLQDLQEIAEERLPTNK